MPMVIVMRSSLPARDLPALLAAANARPGSVGFGTVGAGHIRHLTMEMLRAPRRRRHGHAARGLPQQHDMVAAVAKGEVDS